MGLVLWDIGVLSSSNIGPLSFRSTWSLRCPAPHPVHIK